jgi:molybdopterin-guanine dinucleotide biosynthesis protein A
MSEGPVVGYVLAGGQSRRMGGEKARMLYRGESLIGIATSLLKKITEDVYIVGSIVGKRPELAEYAPVIADKWPGEGPLGGIATALGHCGGENLRAVILAVDMPLMTTEWLERLIQKSKETNAMAVVSVAAGRMQPLCGVYRYELLAAMEAVLATGERRAVEGVRAAAGERLIEVSAIGDEAEWLRNVNTPEELAAIGTKI